MQYVSGGFLISAVRFFVVVDAYGNLAAESDQVGVRLSEGLGAPTPFLCSQTSYISSSST